MTRRRLPRIALAWAALLPSACTDASVAVLESRPSTRVEVQLDGPFAELGMWRYYEGVRLLECELRMEAWADGSRGASAEWIEGWVDLYDLRTGEYLATDYLYASEMEFLWGDAEISSGERQLSRELSYRSYGPYRAHFTFVYDAGGLTDRVEHGFDCR